MNRFRRIQDSSVLPDVDLSGKSTVDYRDENWVILIEPDKERANLVYRNPAILEDVFGEPDDVCEVEVGKQSARRRYWNNKRGRFVTMRETYNSVTGDDYDSEFLVLEPESWEGDVLECDTFEEAMATAVDSIETLVSAMEEDYL